jgi:hypothetical protein
VGDYHISATSPAINRATTTWQNIVAPNDDIDSKNRATPYDIGADEQGR